MVRDWILNKRSATLELDLMPILESQTVRINNFDRQLKNNTQKHGRLDFNRDQIPRFPNPMVQFEKPELGGPMLLNIVLLFFRVRDRDD